jgi:hypothetical protein
MSLRTTTAEIITHAFPEAELPRIEPGAADETYAAGFTPTRTGEWVVGLLIMPKA